MEELRMEKPKNLDIEAWARWNEAAARICLEVSNGSNIVVPAPITIRIAQVPDSFLSLITVVRRAAGELEDGGERDNRIALQLLTALADVARDLDLT